MNPGFLVVGYTGYIGNALFRRLKKKGETLGTSSRKGMGLHLDLQEPSVFDYRIITPEHYVIVAAAQSSPDKCNNQLDIARKINVTGTIYVIRQALDRGAKVIFLSSDTVYGNQTQPIYEDVLCNPSGLYGTMKHEVEKEFLHEENFKTLRLSYVFSREDKFTQYLIHCEKNKNKATIYEPFDRAIIHRNDVTDGIASLIDQWNTTNHRVINFGGTHLVSRQQMTRLLCEKVLRKLTFTITTPNEDFFKNRPKIINMTSTLLTNLLGRQQHTLEQAIDIEFHKADS